MKFNVMRLDNVRFWPICFDLPLPQEFGHLIGGAALVRQGWLRVKVPPWGGNPVRHFAYTSGTGQARKISRAAMGNDRRGISR